MKIGDPPKVQGAALREVKKQGDGAPAKAPAPIDETVLAGIPEADLNPHVREVLFSLLGEVQQLRAELAAAKERVVELEHLADRDPMLETLNRRAFVRELERTLSMVDRYGIVSCLVFCDVNILKTINDQHGHEAGDAVLQKIAATITEHTRQTDMFGRLGGDEFGLLLTHTKKAEAEEKMKSLSELLEAEKVIVNGAALTASISYGIVELGAKSSAQDVLREADTAMYQAKKAR